MIACKECGKLFEPKGREKYCPDKHYRPCPVCGDPVEAKYLSDPPRRCEKCKGQKKHVARLNIVPKSFAQEEKQKKASVYRNVEDVVTYEYPEETDIENHVISDLTDRVYVGPKCNKHLIPGKTYRMSIKWIDSCYILNVTHNLTDDVEMDYSLALSSKISIHQNFKLAG